MKLLAPPGEYNGVFDNTPENQTDDLLEAQLADDSFGNGIFDHKPNVHVGDGVFAAHYALPGYEARESGTGPSEVIDQQTGTPIESFTAGYRNGQQFIQSTQPRWPYPSQSSFAHDYPTNAYGNPFSERIAEDDLTWINPVEGAYPVMDPGQIAAPVARRFRGSEAPVSGFGSYEGRNFTEAAAGLGFLDAVQAASPLKVVVGGLALGALLTMGYLALTEGLWPG